MKKAVVLNYSAIQSESGNNQNILRCILFVFLFLPFLSSAQRKGDVLGKVVDKVNQEPLIGVAITVEGTQPLVGTTTDIEGRFKLSLPVGSYNITAKYIGYAALTRYNVVITSGNASQITFEMSPSKTDIKEVNVTQYKSINVRSAENPVSVQSLGVEEIKSNPGGNFDISRVVQALPGVGGTTGIGGFRNDIIIRGGAPNENVYYLDGIEIPVLNHFTTQGSAGGPAGILNVSFIEDVKLNTSAFDARIDNALSSSLQFKQREGNPERFSGNIRLSGTELATTFEGPINKKTNYMVSARRSYLQTLFKLIDLPIRPNYWDFQYKVVHKFNAKTSLTAIGVGAIDEFTFGIPAKSTPEKEYVLRSAPSINQWNYTMGFTLKRLMDNGYFTVALSRNMFDNALDKFEDKDEGNEARRTLKARSQEIENKLRVDFNLFSGRWKYSFGFVGQYVKFNNNLFNRLRAAVTDSLGNILVPAIAINYQTGIDFFRYGAYAQASSAWFDDKLTLSAGLRTDMNSFTETGNNPVKTLSPRVSASWSFAKKWSLNASVGVYYKLPIYTVLGYKESSGSFVNKSADYTQTIHYVTGFEYVPRPSTRFTLEGFYKEYSNYAVSARDGISLANQGGDFGAIGNEKVLTNGNGRTYGIEFFFQQKLIKSFFTVFSYTWVNSEFSGADNTLKPSAWDNQHLISAIFGKKFKKGYELGLKYRFSGGAPYTPFDYAASQRNYPLLGTGVLDYSQLNTLRLKPFSQLDIRLDKKWNFKRSTFDLYIDIQNLTATKNASYPDYTFERTADNTGFKTTDGKPLAADGSNGIPLILNNPSGTVIPTIGFIVEF